MALFSSKSAPGASSDSSDSAASSSSEDDEAGGAAESYRGKGKEPRWMVERLLARRTSVGKQSGDSHRKGVILSLYCRSAEFGASST